MFYRNLKKAPVINASLGILYILFISEGALCFILEWNWDLFFALMLLDVSAGILIYSLAVFYLPFASITLTGNRKIEKLSVTLKVDGRKIQCKENRLPIQCKVFFPRRGEYDIHWIIKKDDQEETYSTRLHLFDSVTISETEVLINE